MILTKEIKATMEKSVLCWLATASTEGTPNVSPKEIFTYYKEDKIIIANIASPKSKQNIVKNPNVCISFIDILVQKGFQLKGTARVLEEGQTDFPALEALLLPMTGHRFPFKSIFEVTIETSKSIFAPSYLLYPDTTTEKSQIASAKKAYKLDD